MLPGPLWALYTCQPCPFQMPMRHHSNLRRSREEAEDLSHSNVTRNEEKAAGTRRQAGREGGSPGCPDVCGPGLWPGAQ